MKRNILLLIMASMIVPAMAQESTRSRFQHHEIAVYGTLGWPFLKSHYVGETFQIESVDKLDGVVGVGYTFFFHRHWGIATGAEMAFCYNVVEDREITESTPGTYSSGASTESMYFNSTLKDFKETRRATYIHIPLLLRFQTAGRHKFYMAVGAKAGLAVSGKYDAGAASLETSGYFPESGQTFTNMPNHGFTTVQKPSWSGTIDFGLNVSLAVEAGARWAMGKHMALYTGFYFDYGLLDVTPEKTATGLVNYQAATPSEFAYNCTLAASRPSTGAAYVDKVSLFSAGIKMQLAVGW